MNFKKNLAALAVIGTIGLGAASAANVGVVNMAQVMQAYPGYGAIQMQAQKVEQEYAPKLQKLENEINAIKDEKAKQEAIDKKYAPVAQKYNEEMNKIFAPVDSKIQEKLDQVRAQKNLPFIVANPTVIVSIELNSTAENVTDDVIALLK